MSENFNRTPGNYYPPAYHQPPQSSVSPQPRSSVSFKQALHNNRKYLWHFSGRASRTEFWKAWGFWALVTLLPLFLGYIGWIVMLIAYTPNPESSSTFPAGIFTYFVIYSVLVVVLGLINILMTLSLGWRRLQDAGFPGALWLLSFVGIGIVPLIMCMMPSSPQGMSHDGPNDFNRQ